MGAIHAGVRSSRPDLVVLFTLPIFVGMSVLEKVALCKLVGKVDGEGKGKGAGGCGL